MRSRHYVEAHLCKCCVRAWYCGRAYKLGYEYSAQLTVVLAQNRYTNGSLSSNLAVTTHGKKKENLEERTCLHACLFLSVNAQDVSMLWYAAHRILLSDGKHQTRHVTTRVWYQINSRGTGNIPGIILGCGLSWSVFLYTYVPVVHSSPLLDPRGLASGNELLHVTAWCLTHETNYNGSNQHQLNTSINGSRHKRSIKLPV